MRLLIFNQFRRFRNKFNKCSFVLGLICMWIFLTTFFSISYYNSVRIPKDLKILDDMGSRDTKLVLGSHLEVLMQPKDLIMGGLREQDAKKRAYFGRIQQNEILIMVISESNSTSTRKSIRKSWARWAQNQKFSTRVLFFLGISKTDVQFSELHTRLQAESERYDDLIVIDFKESYYRLTVKVLRMLQWIQLTYEEGNNANNSSRRIPTYIVKADHDVFINIPILSRHLLALGGKPQTTLAKQGYYVGGLVFKNTKVDPVTSSKFYLNYKFWINGSTHYPDYLNGPSYIFSGNLVNRVLTESLSVPLFPFEDVYLTGMVMNERMRLNFSNIGMFRTEIEAMTAYDSWDIKEVNFKKAFRAKKSMLIHSIKTISGMENIYSMFQVLV